MSEEFYKIQGYWKCSKDKEIKIYINKIITENSVTLQYVCPWLLEKGHIWLNLTEDLRQSFEIMHINPRESALNNHCICLWRLSVIQVIAECPCIFIFLPWQCNTHSRSDHDSHRQWFNSHRDLWWSSIWWV